MFVKQLLQYLYVYKNLSSKNVSTYILYVIAKRKKIICDIKILPICGKTVNQ